MRVHAGWLAVVATATLVGEGSSSGETITAGARIEAPQGTTFSPSGDTCTWARSTGGDLLCLDDYAAQVGGDWINFGKPSGVAVGGKGVAAIYCNDGTAFQYVYFVGANGSLYQGVRVNGGSISWTSYAPPSGKTLTGHIGAVGLDPFGYGCFDRTAIAATTTDGLLYRFYNPFGGSTSWTDSSGGLTFNTSTPIGSTTDTAMQYGSFFATHVAGGNNELALLRWTPSHTWTTYDLNAPASFQACGSIAATQSQITSTVYRLYVICAATSASSTVAYAYSTGASSTGFTWLTESLSSSVEATWGNVVAGTTRYRTSTYRDLDLYILTNDNHMRRRSHTDSGLQATVDLGLVEEAITVRGSFTAKAVGTLTYSRVLFAGLLGDGTSPDAAYLFERTGETTNATYRYQNYGGSDSEDDIVLGGTRAEGMLAEHKGTTSVAMINRPGLGATDWPRIHVFRSTDDGETFGAAETLGIQTGYDYVVDPTVGVTESRRTYVLQLGQKKTACNAGTTESNVYLRYADNGSSTYTTAVVRNIANTVLDHPFMDIEHKAGADRIHMAWWRSPGGVNTIEYAYYDDGVGLSTIRTIKSADGGPPRVAVNDIGDVYVVTNANLGTSIQVCKLDSSLSSCDGGWFAAGTFKSSDIPVQGSAVIRGVTGYSLAASPTTPGVAYLCYHRKEPADSTDTFRDIVCRRLVFSGGSWTAGAEVAVGPVNDNSDQFFPEVSVTANTFTWDTTVSSEGEVNVSWYDRYNDVNDRTYRVRGARSLNAGMSWSGAQLLNATDSDPEYLPRHCSNSNWRFIGDYSATRASSLHTHPLYVTVPAASIGTDVRAAFRSLGGWWE